MIPMCSGFVNVLILYGLMSLLVTAAAGVVWLISTHDLGGGGVFWWGGFLATYLALAWFIVSWRFFFLIGIALPFVWGGLICVIARKHESFESNREFASRAFRFVAWLYVVGTAITAVTGFIVGGGPVFERGRVYVLNYWLYAAAVAFWIWVFVSLPKIGFLSTARKAIGATLLLAVMASVFMATDVGMLRYYMGPYARLLECTDLHRGSSKGMISAELDEQTVYVDKDPVSNAKFISFLNENTQWQPSGESGRELILKHRGSFSYAVYLRGMSPAFEYLPIHKMFVPPEELGSPVTHICNPVAAAYAEWVGKSLPTEAQLKAVGMAPASINYYGGPTFLDHITADNPTMISHESSRLRCARGEQ